MDDAFVSIIIPTYNRAYCICRAIDSVRMQTHQNWEIIVVDDGSTDDTADIIASHYGDDPRVRYLLQQNAGVSAARNTGIREARGDYLALLDSDDIWKPWKLEIQLACFRSFPEIGMVWTDFEAVDGAGNLAHPRYLRIMYGAYRYFPSPDSLFETSHDLTEILGAERNPLPGARAYVGNIYTAMLRGNLVHTSTVMLSRDRLEKVIGFSEDLRLSGEDYDFHFRTCKWGSVCFVDVASTVYQLEFEDRLTQYKKQIALNFLKTVQAAIEREKGTAQFSPAMIHEVLTEAHSWIAEEMFRSNDRVGARHHALLSLRHKPAQPRMLALLAIVIMPGAISNFLLDAYRKHKPIR